MGERTAVTDWPARFMAGWRFPVVALSLLTFVTALLVAVLLIPPGDSSLAAFAEEFKTWCFGYDPATGELETAYVVMVLTDPLVLAAVIVGVWWKPLRARVARGLRPVVPWVAGAGLAVLGGAALMGTLWSGPAPADGELPFPAERLRTSLEPPRFTLTDQTGTAISLADLEGRVVVLTGVYSTCGHTCPLILQQVKRAVDAVPPDLRSHITVLAISLDPANDTPERMAHMAGNHGMEPPTYRLLTGPPAQVDPVLDRLGITRQKDQQTGVIDHANLFLLVDAEGRIAYRLTLGERQERWLVTALEHLAREAAARGPLARAAER